MKNYQVHPPSITCTCQNEQIRRHLKEKKWSPILLTYAIRHAKIIISTDQSVIEMANLFWIWSILNLNEKKHETKADCHLNLLMYNPHLTVIL